MQCLDFPFPGRFDTKNCTGHDGIMSSNGTCYFESQVTPSEWHDLNETAQKTKLPADEFFQLVYARQLSWVANQRGNIVGHGGLYDVPEAGDGVRILL